MRINSVPDVKCFTCTINGMTFRAPPCVYIYIYIYIYVCVCVYILFQSSCGLMALKDMQIVCLVW